MFGDLVQLLVTGSFNTLFPKCDIIKTICCVLLLKKLSLFLLLDDAPAHLDAEKLSAVCKCREDGKIRTMFLPSNTTSII